MNAKNKSGKIALFGILALLAVLFTASTASAHVDVYFSPDPASIPDGYCNNVTVQVLMDTNASDGVNSWGALIEFDSTCVNITDFEYKTITTGNTMWNHHGNYIEVYNFYADASCPVHPNETALLNITVHCENASYCVSPLDFSNGGAAPGAYLWMASCGDVDIPTTWHNGTVIQGEPAGPEPDLNVTSITVNADCPQGEGYAFANECNNITAVIEEDNGVTVTDSFNVTFRVNDALICEEEVNGITGGTTKEVWCNCSWVPTIKELHYINVTVDDNPTMGLPHPPGKIAETDEGNNSKNVSQMVYWNGYKGKRWAPWDGGDIETEDKYCEQERINLTYSVGDSEYLSSWYHPHWTTYTANWTAADLSIPPAGANIEQATLFIGYTFDKKGIIAGGHYNVKFNDVTQTFEEHDWDRKGFGTSDYPGGLLKFNVTDDFDVMGNNATFTNTWSGGGNVSMQGMVLVVVYQHDSEPRRMIWINKGFDNLWAGKPDKQYCVNETEATAFVPFENCTEPIDKSELKKAELITITTDAFDGDDMNKLYFNAGEWYGFGAPGNKLGATGFGANTTDVLQYLNPTDNVAKFQSTYNVTGHSDNFYACLGILKLEKSGNKTISVTNFTRVQPQEQFEVNVSLDVPGGVHVYGVQYKLRYDPSVLKAESQVTRDFFSPDDTIVVINKIDQAAGVIEYAETLTGDDPDKDCIVGPHSGNLTTIEFTAIGAPGTASNLDIFDVMLIDCNNTENINFVIDNGIVKIYDNPAPEITCAGSQHEKNNAQKKFECWTELCVNVTDEGPKGYNLTYLRWSFGDGQYGTAEGGLPCDANAGECCLCKNHSYISWIYNESGRTLGDLTVKYDPFVASVTVTDDGCPPETDYKEFDVWVFMTGDANGDGKVNILDAVWIGKHFGDTCDDNRPNPPGSPCCDYKWSSNQKSGADLNNDCKINILDAVIVGTMWGHTAY